MKQFFKPASLVPLTLCAAFTFVYAAPPATPENLHDSDNSYYLYTKALRVDKSGVAQVPSRFRWSVETSRKGVDAQANNIPDARVMLRLYDPDHNFTALTAQVDLATAEKLHRELGDMIGKKLQNPAYQQTTQLYDPKDIPTGRFKGIDENGVAIIELEYPDAPAPSNSEPNK